MSTETLIREKPETANLAATMAELGRKARLAAAELALASPEAKVTALKTAASVVRGRQNEILAANADDVAAAKASGIGAALIDRLALDPKRLESVATGLEDIATLPDPVGRVLAEWTRPNGLDISRVAVPLGVIGIIYESRPNVTASCSNPAMRRYYVAGRRAFIPRVRWSRRCRRDCVPPDCRRRRSSSSRRAIAMRSVICWG
jgi:glutamate-5-semialdehyde dehydrogenase